MFFWPELWVAMIQGITEFVPVSSSAHVAILASYLRLAPEHVILADAASNLGTVFAVMVYYHQDLLRLIQRAQKSYRALRLRSFDLGLGLIFATLLSVFVGIVIKLALGDACRSLLSIAVFSVFFGLLLMIADQLGARQSRLEKLTYWQLGMIGCAQALSVVPGVSRSGITLTAARWLCLERRAAYKLSFILAIPVTLASVLLNAYRSAQAGLDLGSMQVGCYVLVGFGLGLVALRLMTAWLQRYTLQPFAIYRVGIGLVLLTGIWFFS